MTNEPGANEEPLGEAAAADRFKPYGEIAEIRKPAKDFQPRKVRRI